MKARDLIEASSIEGISRPSHPFHFAGPVDHDRSTPAFNATHRPHCVWKPCRRTVLPFQRDGDCPCNDHNKGQDLSSLHSLPGDHRTLQAFYLRNPSKREVTWAICQVRFVAGRTISSTWRPQPWRLVRLQGGVGVHP